MACHGRTQYTTLLVWWCRASNSWGDCPWILAQIETVWGNMGAAHQRGRLQEVHSHRTIWGFSPCSNIIWQWECHFNLLQFDTMASKVCEILTIFGFHNTRRAVYSLYSHGSFSPNHLELQPCILGYVSNRWTFWWEFVWERWSNARTAIDQKRVSVSSDRNTWRLGLA